MLKGIRTALHELRAIKAILSGPRPQQETPNREGAPMVETGKAGVTDHCMRQILREARNLYFHRAHLELPYSLYLLAVARCADLDGSLGVLFEPVQSAILTVKKAEEEIQERVWTPEAEARRQQERRRRAIRLGMLCDFLRGTRSAEWMIHAIETLAQAQLHALAALPLAALKNLSQDAPPSAWASVASLHPGLASYLARDRFIPDLPPSPPPPPGNLLLDILAESRRHLESKRDDLAAALYLAAELLDHQRVDQAAEVLDSLWFSSIDKPVKPERVEGAMSLRRLLDKYELQARPGIYGILLLILSRYRSGEDLTELISLLHRESPQSSQRLAVLDPQLSEGINGRLGR